MIELTDEQVSVLEQGYPVRVFVAELGGDVILVLAAQRESTESVLQEVLDEVREQAELSKLGRSAAASWTTENPTAAASPTRWRHDEQISKGDGSCHHNHTGQLFP
jgi:hypothetical protein